MDGDLTECRFVDELPAGVCLCPFSAAGRRAFQREESHSTPVISLLPPSPPSLTKEAASYEKEAVAQEQKIAGMRERGQDIYDIKKQEEVLQESYMMIPDSKARLQAALEDLEAFLVGMEGGSEGGMHQPLGNKLNFPAER